VIVGGRYRVERRLGGGGMATVFLARDDELGRPVAVKLLAENLAGDPALRERFVREARISARLAHPNVVAVYDAGEVDGGRPFIVMEYVEGETLADVLRREGRLDPGRAVDFALQACAGLEHAHGTGLVHRDVKPQNLLVRPDGTLKIADFGIARAAETSGLTQAGTVLGTAAYLAPEQAAGEEVTAAADIYSLGAVLYELLTGRPPLEFSSLAELAYKQSTEPIEPVRDLAPEVPPALEDAIMRALARQPEYRQSSAAELAQELAAASPEAPTAPIPVASGVRATEVIPARHAPLSPKRLAWAGAGVAALAAVAIGLAVGGDTGEPTAPPPPRVEPVPQGATPEQDARNLSEWLRQYSG
jgi:serine/threonine-protein kinase